MFEPLERFQDAFEEFLEGRLTPEEFLAAARELAAALRELQNEFFYEFQFRSFEEELQPLGQTIEDSFAFQLAQLTYLGQILDRPEELEETAESLTTAMSNIFEAFEKVREWEACQERFSDAPHFHEFIRVATAVLEGKLPLEAMSERLQGLLSVFAEFRAGLSRSGKVPEFAGREEELRGHLERIDMALATVEWFLEEPEEEEMIYEALEELAHGGDWMARLLEHLESNPLAEVPCLRCGLPNLSTSRVCSQCGATLLRGQAMSAGLDVRLTEEGIRATESQLPELLGKMVEASQRFGEGDSVAVLQASAEQAANQLFRFEKVLHRLQSLEAAQVDDILGLATAGARRWGEGLELLQEGLDRGHGGQVGRGVELMREGGEAVRELQPRILEFLNSQSG